MGLGWDGSGAVGGRREGPDWKKGRVRPVGRRERRGNWRDYPDSPPKTSTFDPNSFV